MKLHGVGVSPGSAAGPLYVVLPEPSGSSGGASGGIETVRAAAERASQELLRLAAGVRERSPEGADVLEAQAMLTVDPAIEPELASALADGSTLAGAVRHAFEHQAATLAALDEPYLAARADDVREAGRCVAAALTGRSAGRLVGLREPAIVVAADLAPADTLAVDRRLLLGIVTERGGPASHAAIVARELGVPAVVAVAGAVAAATSAVAGELDGHDGMVRLAETPLRARSSASPADRTAAHTWLPLLANAGSAAAVHGAAIRGAQGVGLLRTELCFLGRPSEEEQIALLGAACAAMAPQPVLVRTLDAGSDKALPYLPHDTEPNPALGSRGIRLWLAHAELARTQARALLRVHAEHPNCKVMLPMVAARNEVEQAAAIFRDEAAALGGLPVPALGIMVETPAAALSVSAFAGAIAFLSLGTNDLAQYSAAADRELAWGADLREWNPGTLRLIAFALAGAHELGVEGGVCGELAGTVEGAVLLAGLGATSLSMDASSLPVVAAALNQLGRNGCEAAARAALDERSAPAALAAVRRRLDERR